MTTAVLVSLIVSFLGFFVLFSFFTTTSNEVMNEVDEQKCQAYLKGKASKVGKVADFFLSLSSSCKAGNLEIEDSEKDEVFSKLAERSYSCWRRYGEGEVDFMSNFDTTGKYCFPCTQVMYEGSEDFEYDYREFIEWLGENSPQGEDKTYAELINFEYFDPSSQEFEETETALRELEQDLKEYQEEEGKKTLAPLYLYFSQYRTNLLDMKNKKISSKETNYVVFRYDRLEKSLQQKLIDTGKGAAAASVGSLAAGAVVKIVLTGPIGFVSTITKIAKKAKDANKYQKVVKKSFKVMKLIKKMKKSTKFLAIGSVAAGAAGGTAGASYNKNYTQYVDVLNQGEYYRICGVAPPSQG